MFTLLKKVWERRLPCESGWQGTQGRILLSLFFFFCIISQLFLINPVLKLEEDLLFAWPDFLILKGTLICMEGMALERLHREGLI